MDLGSIFLILALLILVGLFIGRPLFENAKLLVKQQEAEEHSHSMLMAERDRILNALHELDFDHALGKIPEEDYPHQRALLLQRGADILRELDAGEVNQRQETAEVLLEEAIAARRADTAQVGSLVTASISNSSVGDRKIKKLPSVDDDLEALLAQRKRSRQDKSAGFCPQCGSPIQKSDRFCPKCGAKTI